MRRGGITMQQQNHRSVSRTGFAVEDLDSVGLDSVEFDIRDVGCIHGGLFSG
jgi:hypothetical protein